MSKLKSIQAKVEGSIESGINTVEQYYSSVAGKTFDYVETIEEKAKTITAKDIREKHNEKAVSAFQNVRSLNASASEFVSKLLSKIEKDVEDVVEEVKDAVEDVAEEAKEALETVKEAVSETEAPEAKEAAKKPRRSRKKTEDA
ncbi:hypothetical protein [Litoribacillus peritrichatus]|uniref:Phasin domain-containing protein n=1 Tax=Litoribacillus peritrichatus TaxID=718191 RepID=A0ABP7ME94_9GAMM